MPAHTEPVTREPEMAREVLDCAGVGVALVSHDAAVIDFLVEYFAPWFRPTRRAVDWSVAVTSDPRAYASMQQHMPASAAPRPCFAHDREALALPAWPSARAVHVCDAERSCFLRIGRGRVDVIGDPSTRRWRFTLIWILLEIAATRLRRTHVDVHAAALAGSGRALLIAGPKGAGKTTLAFHLMRAHGCALLANDRTFIGGTAPAAMVTGLPTAVKIRPPTLARFPELGRSLPPVARPYLYTLAELAAASASEESLDDVDFALTPNQVALRLAARTHAAAPLGAIVFPQICADETSWSLEPLTSEDSVAGVCANLSGAAGGARPATVFEEFGDGHCDPPQRRVAAATSAVAGYRLQLGRDPYADRSLGERLLQLITP